MVGVLERYCAEEGRMLGYESRVLESWRELIAVFGRRFRERVRRRVAIFGGGRIESRMGSGLMFRTTVEGDQGMSTS